MEKSRAAWIIDWNALTPVINSERQLFLNDQRSMKHQELDCVTKVFRPFMKSVVKNENMEDAIDSVKDLFDVDELLKLPSYGFINFFISLRLFSRKLARIRADSHHSRNQLRARLKQIKPFEQKFSEPVNKRELKVLDEINAYKHTLLDDLKEDVKSRPPLFLHHIRLIFTEGWRMKKNDFLSLIQINKDIRSWDRERVKPYTEWLKEIPDELDYEAFESLIFMQRIEHDRDCYLFDLFMEDMLERMDLYKEQTGKGGFEIFQEITGKPLQTYTAKTDEYGDIVSMELNKPNLKLLDESPPII